MSSFDDHVSSRSEFFESQEDRSVNISTVDTLGDVIQRRFSRRDFLRGSLVVSVMCELIGSPLVGLADVNTSKKSRALNAVSNRFGFTEIVHGVDENHHIAPGYNADILIRWGDKVLVDAPEFDPYNQSTASQLQQFGYNNDFIGYIPLPLGSDNSEHGLLCVNHEYTDEEVMFPGLGKYDNSHSKASRKIVDIEMACHGGSVIEIRKVQGKWYVVKDSHYARRISAYDTEIRIAGPAAGSDRMKTSEDTTGTKVVGTINNCAGGITPWGTYLMAEENFHYYFSGTLEGHPEAYNYARYGVPNNRFIWGRYYKRFDINTEPNEPNRFGWIVEVDPLDPKSTPVKRTALGRFKHEGAQCIVNQDGRLVIYSGDDQRFEYLYKFISENKVDADNREANMDLLDKGTLYVARFNDDGSLDWLPLNYQNPVLKNDSSFKSQADVLIETRRAATLLGATPMDRPEDVRPNPINGKVYVMLTNNSKRGKDGKPGTDKANARANNIWGQVVELTPPNGNHAAEHARWDILVQAGDPDHPGASAIWNPATSENGWFACPDNCAVDPQGRLWVTTDQGEKWKNASGTADGIWALETEGEGRGTGKMFYRVPIGAEMCGPCFTPDGKSLFVAVQHPATDGTKDFPGFERSSTFEDPATRWPDFDPKMPPRPSIVVITKEDGGFIGG
jgi:secreted PhoX family phosphatase